MTPLAQRNLKGIWGLLSTDAACKNETGKELHIFQSPNIFLNWKLHYEIILDSFLS